MTKYRYIPPETIEAILLEDGVADRIAERHGVSRSAVDLIKRLKTKKARKIAETLRAEGREPIIWNNPRRKLNFTDEQLHYIRTSPKTSAEIADEAGCCPSMIRMIRTGKTYVR